MKGRFLWMALFITAQCIGQATKNNRQVPGHVIHAVSADYSFSLASSNYTVHYYKCQWKVDPAKRYITGEVSPHFIVTSAASTLAFDLSHIMQVDSVLMHQSKLAYSQSEDETLTIQLPKNYSPGEKDSLSIFYKGTPPSNSASFVQSQHSGTPIIWTLSEPYGSRDWWPCRNGLDDKADSIDIFITHPAQYKSSSNGMLVSEAVLGNNIVTWYKHRYPIASYLVAFAVTNYSTFTDNIKIGNETMPVISYVYPEDSATFQDNIPVTLNALELYSNTFTPYPFLKEKYGQTQFGFGGGMEHQTNSFIVSPNQNLVTHELAHQWFGDKITCKSWEDIWLNEGFATYCAEFLYCEKFNQAAYLRNVKNDLDFVVLFSYGSVKVSDTNSISRIFDNRLTYKKGAFLLRMLRWTLGDDLFFKAIQNYLSDPSLQYNFATTPDLQHHLENASGADLSYFFKQWYTGEGYPSFTAHWTENTANQVRVTVNQTTSDASVSFFEVPLSLTFKNASQEKTIVVQHTMNEQIFIADIGFKADTLLIDKDMQLISKNNKSIRTPETDTTFPYSIRVYPNPFIDKLIIKLSVITDKKMSVQLLDATGRKIINNSIPVKRDSQTYSFNVPVHLSAGIYFLRIDLDGIISTYTLLRQ